MKLFHVISVSFERSFIMSIQLCLNSFKTTLLQRERRGDGSERPKMKKRRSDEERSLQIIELSTQTQFILSWQRFPFISLLSRKQEFQLKRPSSLYSLANTDSLMFTCKVLVAPLHVFCYTSVNLDSPQKLLVQNIYSCVFKFALSATCKIIYEQTVNAVMDLNILDFPNVLYILANGRQIIHNTLFRLLLGDEAIKSKRRTIKTGKVNITWKDLL